MTADDRPDSGWPAEPDTPSDEGFLARWARRSTLARQGHVEPEPAAVTEPAAPEPLAADAVRIDPRTGKSYDELTDADMPPIESLDPSSDLSVFLAENVSPLLRMKALSHVFRSSRYNQYCLCAEYADDYTQFTPLGSVVPHDLQAAIAREARSLRERLLARGKEISPEEAEARVVAEREAGQPHSLLTEEEESLPLIAEAAGEEVRGGDAAVPEVEQT